MLKNKAYILMIFLLIALLSACGMENRASENAIEISEKPVVSPAGDHSTADKIEISENPVVSSAGDHSTADMNESTNEMFDIPSII